MTRKPNYTRPTPEIIGSKRVPAGVAASGLYRVIVTPDAQLPYEDEAAMRAVEKYVAAGRWDEWVDLGDYLDFDFISSHNVGLLKTNEGKRFDEHFAYGREVLDRRLAALRRRNKAAKMTMLEGNHDWRPEAYIDKRPEMEGLIDVARNLGLKDRGVQWVRCWNDGTIYRVGEAHFAHGLYTTQAHAKKMVEAFCVNTFYGHCFDEQTELLTQRGWLSWDEISTNDICLTMNKDSQLFEWQKVNKKFVYDAPDKMIRVKSANVDLLVDGEHGMVGRYATSHKIKLFKANELLGSFFTEFKVSGYLAEKILDFGISDEWLRLCAWVISEGSITFIGNTPYVEISQSKPERIQEIKKLLDDLKLSYRLVEVSGSEVSKLRAFRFRLRTTSSREVLEYLDKERGVPDWFWRLSDRQFEIFLTEYVKGDGSTYTGKWARQRMIFTNRPDWVDAWQARLIMSGKKTTVYWRDSGGFANSKLCAQINIYDNKEWVHIDSRRHVSEEAYSGKMWCVNVDNGTLVVRRNGRTTVTQNTHDVQCYSKVMHGRGKVIVGQSLGCLCREDQAYIGNNPKNWQQAFGEFWFWPNGMFNYFVPRIFNGRFVSPTGEVYDGN